MMRGLRSWTARVVVAAAVVAAVAVTGATAASASAADTTASGVEVRATQWWLSAMQVTKAHQVTRGKGVKVCLVDGGVDTGFPDLAGTRFSGGTDLTGEGRPDGLGQVGYDDHGTDMATFIAGQGHGPGHAEGILGTAPDAEIISVSTSLDPKGDRAAAFKHCADHGAQIINLSMNARTDPAALAYAQARDLVVVAGTGNDGARDVLESTAGQWGVLGVGGVDRNRLIDPASNAAGPYLGPAGANPNDLRDSAGVAVMGPYSVTPTSVEKACPKEGFYGPGHGWRVDREYLYERTCGTSVATAVVSGIVALVRAAHPDLNAANVINRIVRTATPPPDGSKTPSPLYGYGLVNAYAAVTADIPAVEHNPLGSTYTHSRGIWDHRVTPQRPEPPAHSRLPATDWHDDTPATNANGAKLTPAASTGQGNPKPVTRLLPSTSVITALLLAAAIIAIGAGITIAVIITTRRRKATRPPFYSP